MARSIPVADQAIASAAMEEIAAIYEAAGISDDVSFPQFLLECASRVKFQPSTRQLVLTFDLATGGQDERPQD